MFQSVVLVSRLPYVNLFSEVVSNKSVIKYFRLWLVKYMLWFTIIIVLGLKILNQLENNFTWYYWEGRESILTFDW